jgi:hypothetical protein
MVVQKKLYLYRLLLLIFGLFLSLGSFSQSFWKIEYENGDEVLITLALDNEAKTFEAYSRKDALKDIAGIFTYNLAKAAGKLKYAEIVFIEGTTRTFRDTLLLTGLFTYLDKQFQFSASLYGNHFKGKCIDTKNRTHILTGIKVPDNRPIKNYPLIIKQAFELTGKTLIYKEWLDSDEWLDFKKKVEELAPDIADDYELAASFYWHGKKLPFSPYEISRINPYRRAAAGKNPVTVTEIKPGTVLLNASSLPSVTRELDSIARIINKKGYSNLIIDLRGRNKITATNAVLLLDYLTDKAFNAGAYLTAQWFDKNSKVPLSEDYITKLKWSFGESNPAVDLYKESGRYLKIVPIEKRYKGKVYLLADSKSSKVSEALIYIVKHEKIGTVVGQKTAGLLTLSERLQINTEYDLTLPVYDFYTGEGKNLNKIGIEPDLNVRGEDALKYLLKIL